jgi:hypothetical protein
MYISVHVCTYVYMYVHMCTCMYICVLVWTFVYLYVHLCTCMYIYTFICRNRQEVILRKKWNWLLFVPKRDTILYLFCVWVCLFLDYIHVPRRDSIFDSPSRLFLHMSTYNIFLICVWKCIQNCLSNTFPYLNTLCMYLVRTILKNRRRWLKEKRVFRRKSKYWWNKDKWVSSVLREPFFHFKLLFYILSAMMDR